MRPACASRSACLVGWGLPVVGTPDADHRRRRCCHLVESVFPPIRGCSHQSLVRCRVGFQVAAVVLDAEVPLVVSVRQDERVHRAGQRLQDGLALLGDLAPGTRRNGWATALRRSRFRPLPSWPVPAGRRGCGLPTSSGRGVGFGDPVPERTGAPGRAGAPGRVGAPALGLGDGLALVWR